MQAKKRSSEQIFFIDVIEGQVIGVPQQFGEAFDVDMLCAVTGSLHPFDC